MEAAWALDGRILLDLRGDTVIEDLICEALEAELPIENRIFENEFLSTYVAAKIEFRGVKFLRCRFLECDFTGAAFLNVELENCDISNCGMEHSYWKKCNIRNSKGHGTNFSDGVFREVKFEDTKLDYANFGRTRLEQAEMTGCSFVSASFAESRWKKVQLQGDIFDHTDFFKTPLRGIDFSACQVNGLLLSDDLREIRGARFNMFQAVEIAKLAGIEVV